MTRATNVFLYSFVGPCWSDLIGAPQYEGPGSPRSFAFFARPMAFLTRESGFAPSPRGSEPATIHAVPPLPNHPDAVAVTSALRADRGAVLMTPEGPSRRPSIIDASAGVLVIPMSDTEAGLESATLFVPDESDQAVQVLILPSQSTHASDADMDRFRAAHGTPDPITLYRLKIDGARLGGRVVDGPDIDLKDPFLTESGAIRRALNANRTALTRACTYLGIDLGARGTETLVALSVDPEGIDLKGPTGLGRYRFDKIARDRDHLRSLASPLLPFDPNATRV